MSSVGGMLFLVAIFVVDTDEGAAEGEYLAKGDEDGVVDLCQWRANEARHQHRASKNAECNCAKKLNRFHILRFSGMGYRVIGYRL